MILINDCWENVATLQDVSKVIREYYNRELANELDNLIDEKESEIKGLEMEIDSLQEELGNYD